MGAYQNNEQKPKRKAKKPTSYGNWGGYVDCPMGKSERNSFLIYAKDSVVSIFDSMGNMADSEINLSMSWSDKDQSYLAKATAKNPADGKGYMLSAFHSDVETAWLILIFKHFILLGEEWFHTPGEDDTEDNWG